MAIFTNQAILSYRNGIVSSFNLFLVFLFLVPVLIVLRIEFFSVDFYTLLDMSNVTSTKFLPFMLNILFQLDDLTRSF